MIDVYNLRKLCEKNKPTYYRIIQLQNPQYDPERLCHIWASAFSDLLSKTTGVEFRAVLGEMQICINQTNESDMFEGQKWGYDYDGIVENGIWHGWIEGQDYLIDVTSGFQKRLHSINPSKITWNRILPIPDIICYRHKEVHKKIRNEIGVSYKEVPGLVDLVFERFSH